MRAPSSRTRRIVSLSAAPVAVLLAGAMVWQGSSAAFTAEHPQRRQQLGDRLHGDLGR